MENYLCVLVWLRGLLVFEDLELVFFGGSGIVIRGIGSDMFLILRI